MLMEERKVFQRLLSWEAAWGSRKSGLRTRAMCLVLVLPLVSCSGSGSQKVFTN